MPARKGQKYKPRTKEPLFSEILKCALCPRKFKRNHSQHKYCENCREKAKLEQTKEWLEDHPEKRREYYRNYYDKNSAHVIARTQAYTKTERGKEARRIADANQKLYNTKKVAARQAVKVALVAGTLIRRPCEMCGALKVEAHHEDYDKPLEVRWLCRTDHRKLHRRLTIMKYSVNIPAQTIEVEADSSDDAVEQALNGADAFAEPIPDPTEDNEEDNDDEDEKPESNG